METEAPTELQDFVSDAAPPWPRSYTENSAEEEQLLVMARSFQRHMRLLYPDRKPLLLCPANECGLQKLVTTTLRPTFPAVADLHTWQQCARFVSDFLTLQPLEPPTELPASLRSPQFVLRSQRGSSLEFTNLLCSLLLGLDYDAYCVSGYASRRLCELDRRRDTCPLLEEQSQDQPEETEQEAQDDSSTYNKKRERKVHSNFLLKQQKKLEQQQQQQPQTHTEPPPPPAPDPLWGLRVHFWVLVLAGSRSVEHDFFIDPLSGNSFPTKHPDFLGVESVWNELNVYVYMEDCANGCQDVVWDPEDRTHWEPLVPGTTSRKQLQALAKNRLDLNEETGPPYSYDMPLSWCSMIHITEKDMELRWPQGFKVTHFKQASVENFIPFFCPDGVVTRLTLYQDHDKRQVQTVREWFEYRSDRLKERETSGGFTTETFKPGRDDTLIFHRFNTRVPEACPDPSDPAVTPEREMRFVSFRPDGLVRRLERGDHMIETFEKRRDFLFQRDTQFRRPADAKTSKEDGEDNTEGSWNILEVVEQFHRDPSKAAGEDIAKREFLLAERRIEVTYHLEDNLFIPSKRSFKKPTESTKKQKAGDFTMDMVSTFQVDGQGETLKLPQLQQLLHSLMEHEQKTIRQIKNSMSSVQSLVQSRAVEEKEVQLETRPWTTSGTSLARKRRERAVLLGEELRWLEQQQKDLLAPALMRLNGNMELRPDQVQTLYQDCLQDFRNRMVQRATLIQERIDQESRDLQEQQPDDLTKPRQIHIARKRLEMLKECGPQKYKDLEQKLRGDPRIGPHLNPPT
ncbi:hypothetical protein NL108_017914 [Boleophthalmus pectinirostris]|uniref:dynein regulatory complex subunit 7 n=1 Tax=Boleophthalmus pectinirostris TaxID=150288 RepID=UPI00242BA493|nr:dynein regulatory complex subunit 7 [Boleophthalmus pectinirostris]KAJ0070705.1 hypothetical protein NL108_017914 [Boleophthalmus pectinirostris]